MNRRENIKLMLGATAASVAVLAGRTTAFAQAAGPFTLPPLGYAYEALEPHIDAMTMTIHHQRHHGAFIGNLNNLANSVADLRGKAPEAILANLSSIPESSRTAVRNNLGGHWNHTFFWDLMTPGGAKEPAGDLKAAIDAQLGGFQKVKEQLNTAGLGRFGSGWAWLIVDNAKKLKVVNTPYQDNPLMDGARSAVIGVDVWEHAYYLKYQNRRGDYLNAWWNTVNWDKAAANFRKGMA